MRKQRAPELTGMEEIVTLEHSIRELVPKLHGTHKDLRDDARRIMRGRLGSGTRLGHLRRIVAELETETKVQHLPH
jgi:hypothetical protein